MAEELVCRAHGAESRNKAGVGRTPGVETIVDFVRPPKDLKLAKRLAACRSGSTAGVC